MAATTRSEVKPRQLQIARLRREDDEETWISGEELCTEGSSDDEGHGSQPPSVPSHTQLKHQLLARRISAPAHLTKWELTPKEASEPVIRDEPHLTETTRRLSEMGVDTLSLLSHDKETSAMRDKRKEEVEEQEEVMLWRPKRGSIKLPKIDLDPTPSRAPQQKVTG